MNFDRFKKLYKLAYFHLFETDDVIINWPDFNKAILLLAFGFLILSGHMLWYVLNMNSENRLWLSEAYYTNRIFTLSVAITITLTLLCVTFFLRRNIKVRKFMGGFAPLYFGLMLLFSGYTIGFYTPATMAGTVNIFLIGLVLYKRKIIYSIGVVVVIVIGLVGYLTYLGIIPYAPLLSENIDDGDFFRNKFWLESMVILYLPIFVVSALFFEILLSQWRRREKKIKKLSETDALTEVFNRRYIAQKLTLLEQQSEYAIVLLDLDYFKKINDEYGHEAGDFVLKHVADLLSKTVRVSDVVGRFGGEEFIIILNQQTLTEACDVAERCRSNIQKQPITLTNGITLCITASFGVALSAKGQTKDSTIRMADQALYLAKQEGRNQIRTHRDVIAKM